MTAYRGNADVRTARFEDWNGVAQLPPDVAITLSDPRGAVVIANAPATALPGPIAAGAPTHSYTWTPSVNANLGTWVETWTATILGEPVISNGTFRVSDSLRAGGTKPIDDPGPTQAVLQTYDPLLAANLRGSIGGKADGAAMTAALATKQGLIVPGAYVPGDTAAAPFSGRLPVAIIGDSVSEGFYADGNPGTWAGRESQGFAFLLDAALKARHGDGGRGFYGMWKSQVTKTAGWAVLGSYSPYQQLWYVANDATQTITFTGVLGDSATIVYTDGTVPNGTMAVTVDGGAPFNVALTEMADLLIKESTPFSLGAYGAHTVVIRASATATPKIVGLSTYRGTSGAVVHHVSRQGNSTVNHGVGNAELSYLDAFKPRLTILVHALNDYNQQVPLATYGTNLGTIIDRAKLWGDVLVVLPLDGETSLAIPYTSYISQAKTTAPAKNVRVVSMADYWGTYAANAALRMADVYHPNARGHTDMASVVLQRVPALAF